MSKKIHHFYCKNGAYHDYICCDTCANRFKKKGEKGDFRLTHSEEIEESRRFEFLDLARQAGFTTKQAMFLYPGQKK